MIKYRLLQYFLSQRDKTKFAPTARRFTTARVKNALIQLLDFEQRGLQTLCAWGAIGPTGRFPAKSERSTMTSFAICMTAFAGPVVKFSLVASIELDGDFRRRIGLHTCPEA